MKKPTRAVRKKPEPPTWPLVVETFMDPRWEVGKLNHWNEPSAFNGTIRIDRYRVTAEKINEPVEVLRERLKALWRSTERNSHLFHAFETKAKELGMDYRSEFRHEDFGADYKP